MSFAAFVQGRYDWDMLRKSIITLMTLAATLLLTTGLLAGSGRTSWNWCYPSDEIGRRTGDSWVFVGWGTNRLLTMTYTKYLGTSATESQSRRSGPGWLYDRSIILPDRSEQYVESRMLIVYWVYLASLGCLFGVYPAAAFCLGPLRRWRRYRRGFCLHCGYNLAGNETGICSECGSDVAAGRTNHPVSSNTGKE